MVGADKTIGAAPSVPVLAASAAGFSGADGAFRPWWRLRDDRGLNRGGFLFAGDFVQTTENSTGDTDPNIVSLVIVQLFERLGGRIHRHELRKTLRLCEQTRGQDHRQDDSSLPLGLVQKWRKLLLLDEVGGEKISTDEQDGNLRGIDRPLNLVTPAAGLEPGIVPPLDPEMLQRLEMHLKPFQPGAVPARVADENLRLISATLIGSHAGDFLQLSTHDLAPPS